MIRMLALGLAVVALAPAHAGQTVPPNAAGQYAPRDECGEVPGADSFRADLAEAIRQRDSAAVAALAASTVKLDFGGGEGTEELRRRLDAEGGERLWLALRDVLDGGCVFDGDYDLLMMPWLHAQDLGDTDPYSTWVVAGTKVPLRKEPDSESEEVEHLTWQLVVPMGGMVGEETYHLVSVVGSDRNGHIEAARLRSPLDYRIIAEKIDNSWKIVAFVAGD